MRPRLGANAGEFNLETEALNSLRGTSAKKQAEAIHNHNHRAAFVANYANSQWNLAQQGEGHEDNHSAQGNEKVLADDSAGALAQTEGGEKILEAVMHENDVGLFEGGIGAA